MEHIAKYTGEAFRRPKGASHPLGAAVDEIGKAFGFTPKYGRGFYLRWLKAAGWSYGTVMAQLKLLTDKRDGAREPAKLLVWKMKQDAAKRPKTAVAKRPVRRRVHPEKGHRAQLPAARTGSLFGEA